MRKQTTKQMLLLVMLAIAGLFLVFPDVAQAANPNLINFQGKVVNANGTNVSDASYTFRFCLYTTATPATPCTGAADNDAVWRESKSISTTNGIFQTELGSVTTMIDVSAYTNLYLGINFNADAAGEMTPRIHFNSVPYALNTDKLGGLTSSNFVQLAQGVQTDSSATNPSIFINKTGATVNILQLQKASSDVLVIANSGLSTFFTDVDFTLAGTENLVVSNTTASNSVDLLSLTLTNSDAGANAQRGLVITNADDAANATTEALLSLNNAEVTASTVTDGLIIAGSAGAGLDTIVDGIDVSDDNITNGINIGTNFLVASGDSINDFTGNGALVVATNALTLDATVAGDGLSATTSTGSGLEVLATGLTLLQGCADTQILKWVESSDVWNCAADATGAGGSPTLDAILAATAAGTAQDSNANSVFWNWDFTTAAVDSGLTISESTNSTSGTQDQQALLELITLANSTASPLQVTAGGTDVADVWFDLSGTSDFEIRDAGASFITFRDDSTATFNLAASSTTALVIQDGGTDFVTIDTTNGRFGIGGAPATVFEVINSTWATNRVRTITGGHIGTFAADDVTGGITLFSDSGSPIYFSATATAGSHITLEADGDTIIGATTGSAKLHVQSSAATTLFKITDGSGTPSDVLTVADEGAVTVAPRGTSDISLTLDDDSSLITTGTVTNTGFLQDINLTLGNDLAADTVAGLNIDVTSVDTGADGDILRGLDIANLTGGNANVTEQALRIGTGWDVGLVIESGGISVSGGEFVLTNGSRHTRYISLAAEFEGAVLTGDGTNNTGTMTSDAETSSPFRTYYNWTSTAANDYDVWIKVPLPEDWVAWSGTGGTATGFGTAADEGVTIEFFGTNNTTICSSDIVTAVSWNTDIATCNYTGGTFATSGNFFTIRVKLAVTASGDNARIANIKMPYLSKW
ncbi:hypothetical protein H0X09_01785 [Candidatus Saccharibacteria bacterium]|nr:hypothetical protein [Candidatus Saccharibacteria bacterium]